MAFIFSNPNPINHKVGDCVVRAISLVTNSSWEEAYMNLCLKGLEMCDMPNSNCVWISFLKDLGYKKFLIPDTCPECYTIEDFAGEHFIGKYILATGEHTVAVINGDVYDAWDSRQEIPIMYFQKEE